MDTLAEPILERDKERGRRRSLALRQGRVTQSQPKIGQPNIDNDGEARLSAVCGVAPPRRSAEDYAFVVAPCIRPKFGLPMRPLFVDDSAMIIAIDGPAGAGKSTIAKLIALKLGFLYIDTGAMYRALTLKIINQHIDSNNVPAIITTARATTLDLVNNPDGSLQVFLDGRDVSAQIRGPKVTRFVSDIAKIPEVREIMVTLQRSLGKRGNSVLEGRDIGSVVFPDAQKKFYLDAEFSQRTQRRWEELELSGQSVSLDDVAVDLRNRDTIDSTRKVAPLKKTDDAIIIDTTAMTIDEVVNAVLSHIPPSY